MNKLAAIQDAVEEINKQAFIGLAARGLAAAGRFLPKFGKAASGVAKAPKAAIPPVNSAGLAANASATKASTSGLSGIPGVAGYMKFNNSMPGMATSIAAPMVFKGQGSPLPRAG